MSDQTYQAWKTTKENLTSECLDESHHNVEIKSDTLFLAEIGLPPAKLDPPRIGLDVIFKYTTKPCAWAHNPQFWNYAHPRLLGKGHPPTNPQFWSSTGTQG